MKRRVRRALGYLFFRSAVNRARRLAERLKKPRYAAAFAAGVVYFGWIFVIVTGQEDYESQAFEEVFAVPEDIDEPEEDGASEPEGPPEVPEGMAHFSAFTETSETETTDAEKESTPASGEGDDGKGEGQGGQEKEEGATGLPQGGAGQQGHVPAARHTAVGSARVCLRVVI